MRQASLLSRRSGQATSPGLMAYWFRRVSAYRREKSVLSGPPMTSQKKESIMNTSIKGIHLEVTPALREAVLAKLQKVTGHFDKLVSTSVVLSVEKLQQRAEVTVHIKGKDLYAEHSGEDMYAAIDQVMEKLDRQLAKHKEQQAAKRHDPSVE